MPEGRGEPRFERTTPAAPPGEGGAPKPLVLTLALKSPPREATALREVSGEVELLMPGRDPNSVADVKDFLDAPGRSLASPALAASSVELVVLGPAQLEEEKKNAVARATADAKKKKATAEMLEFIAETAAENFLVPDEGDVVLSSKDPEGRIESFALVTPAGEEKRASASSRQGFLVLASWGEKPGPGWTLRVRLKTPKSFQADAESSRDS